MTKNPLRKNILRVAMHSLCFFQTLYSFGHSASPYLRVAATTKGKGGQAKEGCTTDAQCQSFGDKAAYCKSNGYCRCDMPYHGEYCDQIYCPGLPLECSGHGRCDETKGTCNCTTPYTGTNCSVVKCPGKHHNCSYPHGICNEINGTCRCKSPYTGVACDEKLCPKNCSSHGDCDSETGECKCFGGWIGDACDEPAPTPGNCSICNDTYCKCNLVVPYCQGTTIRCDACCDPKPPLPTKIPCEVEVSPLYPPEDVVYSKGCEPNSNNRPSGTSYLSSLMHPLPYDNEQWPSYDSKFDYDGSGNDGVSNGNYTLFFGVRPDPGAAAAVFASNDRDVGWYASFLNASDRYRDCSRACDADSWTLASAGDVPICETSFNVPQYQIVEMNEDGIAEKKSLVDWPYGPVRSTDAWIVDFSKGLSGELGMVTSLNGQGMAVPNPETGHWHDNVEIVWDDDAPLGPINASSLGEERGAKGKYVAKLDTYVENRNGSWVIDSTGGLVTSRQFMSGVFEVTAKVPQSSGQVFALWLFNGAKTWSAHVPYVDPASSSSSSTSRSDEEEASTCFAPSAGCAFFNKSNCVDPDNRSRCPFDPVLNMSTCAEKGGSFIDKNTAPFTCLGDAPYQSYSADPLWIDRLSSPGDELPQLCKEFPNAEIDWEIPSNAPQTLRGAPFTPHPCSENDPCEITTKYNTSNLNNYRFTDGSGEGTYANIWVERSNGEFIDGKYHTYRIEVHSGTRGGCEPRVDYFFDGEYVGTNNAFVPRVAGRMWILFMDRTTWSSGNGGWNGKLNLTTLSNATDDLEVYSSVMVSDIRVQPFLEDADTYAPQAYDQPSMGSGYLADCGKKNPPPELDTSFIPYTTSDASEGKIGHIKWIRND